MHLAQDNDVVQTLTPDRSDQPFGKAVLPGRGPCDRLVPDIRDDIANLSDLDRVFEKVRKLGLLWSNRPGSWHPPGGVCAVIPRRVVEQCLRGSASSER
jgi:hypothetical protein